MGFTMRFMSPDDDGAALPLYNSNPDFLKHHLGVSAVAPGFLRRELREMAEAGFRSVLLLDGQTGETLGLCDYRPGPCVYLSLLLLDGRRRGRGLGSGVYRYLEAEFARQGADSVRIDVVDDYEGNVLGFWVKQGFRPGAHIELQWGEKTSGARVLKKTISG